VSSSGASTGVTTLIQITDGVTTKDILRISSSAAQVVPFDFNIFLKAGESCQINCGSNAFCRGSARQIADINGNLVDP
jgi:hypothetical protein